MGSLLAYGYTSAALLSMSLPAAISLLLVIFLRSKKGTKIPST
jgi:hypothetical protein